MAKYKAIAHFKDVEDKGKVYEVGGSYPRPANKNIPEERIEELKTKKSKKTGKPFIEEVEEDERD